MSGIGYMIQQLRGNEESVKAYTTALGKTIASLNTPTNADTLDIRFEDGTGIRFTDEGQSCCEYRHMTCDDDLSPFVGATLVSAELRDGEDIDAEYDVHEVQFLIVTTSKGDFTVASHNEHNGYYGGICLRVSSLPKEN